MNTRGVGLFCMFLGAGRETLGRFGYGTKGGSVCV